MPITHQVRETLHWTWDITEGYQLTLVRPRLLDDYACVPPHTRRFRPAARRFAEALLRSRRDLFAHAPIRYWAAFPEVLFAPRR